MRKQVTFVKQNSGEHLIRDGSSRFVATRSAGYCCPQRSKCIGSDSLYSDLDHSMRTPKTDHLKCPQPISVTQRLNTIDIPKSMMAAPFLQHPSLTPGQKRYLYSIANIYSTEHMRTLMKRHYLNVLHKCIRAGHDAFAEKRTPRANAQPKRRHFEFDGHTDFARTKATGDRHRAGVHSRKITLPRIGDCENRIAPNISTSNGRQSRKLKTHAYMAQKASLKSTKLWSDPPQKQQKTGEESLSENMSSLSIEEEEEIFSGN